MPMPLFTYLFNPLKQEVVKRGKTGDWVVRKVTVYYYKKEKNRNIYVPSSAHWFF
jgi:hypothetical protein